MKSRKLLLIILIIFCSCSKDEMKQQLPEIIDVVNLNSKTPNGYIRIIFNKGSNGEINGTNAWDVKKGVSFKNLKPKVPSVKPKETHLFTGWKPVLPSENTSLNSNLSFTAQYKIKEKSAKPSNNEVFEGDLKITGKGVAGAEIVIKLPNNQEKTTTVKSDKTWNINVASALKKNEILKVKQLEKNKLESDEITFKVKQKSINFTDAKFKEALLNHTPKIDLNQNGEIEISEASSFDGAIDIRSKQIKNIKGIEFFENLKELNVSFNNIEEINLTGAEKLEKIIVGHSIALKSLYLKKNSLLKVIDSEEATALTNITLPNVAENLTEINFRQCRFSTMDVSNYLNLERLTCDYNNNLTVIKLPDSSNSKLEDINFQETKVTEINTSKMLNLRYITLRNTSLTTLDLSKNKDLRQVYGANNKALISVNVKNGKNSILTDLELNNCSKLTKICVDNVADAQSKDPNKWKKDTTASYSIDCN